MILAQEKNETTPNEQSRAKTAGNYVLPCAAYRQPQLVRLFYCVDRWPGKPSSTCSCPPRPCPRVGAAMRPQIILLALASCTPLAITLVATRPHRRQRHDVRQRLAEPSVVHQIIGYLEIYNVGLHLHSTRGLFTSAAPARHQRRLRARRRTRLATTHRRGPPPGPRRWPFGPRELLRGHAPRYQEARHNAAPVRRSGCSFEKSIVVVASSA